MAGKNKEPEKAAPTEEVLVEDNRFTPYGALTEKQPGRPVQGAPIKKSPPPKD
jgi:hypothetical protein